MKNDRENIGERIKQYRKANNLSVPALEKMLDIPKDRIYKWEKGTVPYDTADYEKIESLLNGKFVNISKTRFQDRLNNLILNEIASLKAAAKGSLFTDELKELKEQVEQI